MRLHNIHNLMIECTSVGVSVKNKIILAKNRDRTYYPKLKIIRELINGIETCYMYDVDTDYSEGMNEKGIGIVNTTLQGKEDEKETKTVQKHKKLSADGHKIRTALGMDDTDERFNLTNFQRFQDKTFKILVYKAINKNICLFYD